MREVYFESEYVCLWFDETEKTGGGIWNGLLPSKEYREAFFKALQLTTEKKLENWIGDNRKMKDIGMEDQEWTLQMMPGLMASGLKRMATIVSEDIYNHMTVINLFDKANSQITFQNQYFRNETDAQKWLQQFQNSVETAHNS